MIDIQRLDNELLIRIPVTQNLNIDYIQRLLDYFRFISIAGKSQATEEQILEIANDINKSWFQDNKHLFIK